MAIQAKYIQAITLLVLLISNSAYAEQVLTIEYAVQTALKHDALISVYQSRRDAFKEQSIAEDTLPDPTIKLGMMNLPTDTFKRNQEPMTQLQIGIQQMFPRGNSLEIKSQRANSLSLVENAKTENQFRKVSRDVRETWLELYYWLNAESVVRKNRKLFSKLVTVTKQQYASGRQKQQDVIRSELELGMLDDRELKIQSQIEINQATLAKYIGSEYSKINIDNALPEFNIKNDSAWLNKHPMINMERAMVSANLKNVELAKQSYKPSWMVDLTYGQREDAANGAKRADFISAMVVLDVPLFTGNKQDKNLAASKFELNSALNSHEERKRDLNRMWKSGLAKEKQLSLRIKKYKSLLVPKARENTKAAMVIYQSGRGSFTALMRAQITELETQLSALRIQVDHKKTQAQLLYFVGENSRSLTTSVLENNNE